MGAQVEQRDLGKTCRTKSNSCYALNNEGLVSNRQRIHPEVKKLRLKNQRLEQILADKELEGTKAKPIHVHP